MDVACGSDSFNFGAAGNAVVERAYAEAAAGADAVADFGGFGVGVFVEEAAFGGEAVFGPLLFEVDEAPLALAEGEMLKGGEGEEIGFGEHGLQAFMNSPARLALVLRAPSMYPRNLGS